MQHFRGDETQQRLWQQTFGEIEQPPYMPPTKRGRFAADNSDEQQQQLIPLLNTLKNVSDNVFPT